MGSAVPAFEAAVEIGVSDGDGASLAIRFDADGTYLLSTPDSQLGEGIQRRPIERKIH